MQIDESNERIIVIANTIIIYLMWMFVMYYKFLTNDFLTYSYISMLICMALAGLVTKYWKISLHSTAISGMVVIWGYLVYVLELQVFFEVFLISIIAWGVLCSARMYLNKHDAYQIYAGTVLGIVCAIAGLGLQYFY